MTDERERSAAHRGPVHVLLVEDNPADIRLMREALRESNTPNHLHVITDGESALAYLRRSASQAAGTRPELILLDLNLPRKGGFEVLYELKQDARYQLIPVVILSSSPLDEDIARAYALGAACYITKPFDFDEHVAMMASLQRFWLSVVALPRSDDRADAPGLL